MSSIVISGDTSGSVTLQAPAVSGSTVLTLPSTTGTILAPTSGTLSVAQGGTGATSLTANNVILGNGTSAVATVAPGTSGNVLTSDGTTWASSAGGSYVSLGTITFSGTGNQFSLGSLTLTNYKQLYITHSATIGVSCTPSISNTTGDQSASNNWSKTNVSNSITAGWISIDLYNGSLFQGYAAASATAITLPIALGGSPGSANVQTGPTAIGTATTTIYVYIPGAATKSGTMTIYGVK